MATSGTFDELVLVGARIFEGYPERTYGDSGTLPATRRTLTVELAEWVSV